MSNFFRYKDFVLEYIVFGNGPEKMLALHGFGRNAHNFLVFEDALKDKYTVFSFAIFHHGKSKYPDNRIHSNTLQKQELKELVEVFLMEQNIERFSLMGYSLGGKLSFMLMEFFAERINKVFLFAAEGMKERGWYNRVSHSIFWQRFFRIGIQIPILIYIPLRLLQWFKFIKPASEKFLIHKLDTEKKRQLVYDVWMTFRDIHPNIELVQNLINAQKIDCKLFYGKYDTIIPVELGEVFSKKLNNPNVVYCIDTGHSLISAKVADYLTSKDLL